MFQSLVITCASPSAFILAMDDIPPKGEFAHHEAGHAVVSTMLDSPPDYLTIERNRHTAGASGPLGGYKRARRPKVQL